MIKVFIIDDEIPIRQWIRFCIERSDSNYVVVGESANGNEAINLLSENDIDVAILDIMLPGVNGLEVLKNIKSIKPSISIIMLTNFAEFEYLQKAVRLGVEEYFLKSEITEETLMQCLDKITSKLENNQKMKNSVLDSMENTVVKLGESILNKSIRIKQEFLDTLKNFPDPTSFLSNLFVIGIRLKDNEHFNSFCLNMNKMSGYLTSMYYINFQKNTIFLVCEMEKLKSKLIMFNSISDILEWIRKNISFQYIGISNVYDTFSYYYEAMNEALCLVNQGFYACRECITYAWQLEDKTPDDKLLNNYIKNTVNIAKTKSFDELCLEISLIFDYFKSVKPTDPQFVIDYFLELAYLIRSVYMSNSQTFISLDKNLELKIREQFQNCSSIDMLSAAMKDALKAFSDLSSSPDYSEFVTKSIEYINTHYTDNITLSEVADYVHISKDYLGKIFKKETGENFNTFVTNVKMKYADYLIRNTNMRKYEISEKLGYINFSYFSRIYSKYKSETSKTSKV